jgi:hypothetical protein
MSYSVNEIANLAQKAARGAGFPPAQADLFGRAAAQHLGAGGAPGDLTEALADPADSPILRLPLLLDDIQRVLPLAGPDLILSLQPGDTGLVKSYVCLLPLRLSACEVMQNADGPPRVSLSIAPGRRTTQSAPLRIEAPWSIVDMLNKLAAETYVPATDDSRAAGAGAGNIDND